jgi:uncharacterized protein (DUF1697 family)
MRHVALLRGINVGGRNRVAMRDVRAAFEDAGFTSVATYIQSGNVLFDSAPDAGLEARVEQVLDEALGLPVIVVVRDREQMRAVAADAPPGFGQGPDLYHSDVIFLKDPLTAEEGLKAVELRDGVDVAWAGEGVLYCQRLSAQRTKSRLSRVMSRPEYRLMTIRNWNTTARLAEMVGT